MAYEIVTTDGIAHFRLHGQVAIADIRAIMKELDVLEAALKATPNRLVDISDVDNVVMDFQAMHEFAETRAKVRLHNETKTAIVAASVMQYGCARMFEMVSQQRQTTVAVFRDLPTARSWLAGEAPAQDKPV